MLILAIVIVILASLRTVNGIHSSIDFEYTPGFKALVPCQWASEYPTCGGQHQSPVDLPENQTAVCQPPLGFKNLLEEPKQVELIHMLHTPLVKYHMNKPVTVHGGPLSGSYTFDHYNVRWGEDGKKGSEHTVGGKSYAAIGMEDGVVIFSVFLDQVGYPDNFFFDEMLGMMDYVTQPWSYTDLCERIPFKYYLPDNRRNYYTYKGSLTYPPCPENVIWIVFEEAVPFSRYQLLKLRRMIGVRGSILTNSRPTQQTTSEIFKVQTPPGCKGE